MAWRFGVRQRRWFTIVIIYIVYLLALKKAAGCFGADLPRWRRIHSARSTKFFIRLVDKFYANRNC